MAAIWNLKFKIKLFNSSTVFRILAYTFVDMIWVEKSLLEMDFFYFFLSSSDTFVYFPFPPGHKFRLLDGVSTIS